MTHTSSNPQGTAVLPSNRQMTRLQFGEWLKQARERSGISIDAVSQETRISKSYIVSLEAGDLEGLPGRVFGRGFVKNITRLLKTDTSEGLRLYDACWDQVVVAPVSERVGGNASTVEPSKVTAPRIREIETKSVSIPVSIGQSSAGKTSGSHAEAVASSAVMRLVMNPRLRLWILSGVATAFAAVVFGRWVADAFEKNRAAQSNQLSSAVVPMVSQDSGPAEPEAAGDSDRQIEASRLAEDRALAVRSETIGAAAVQDQSAGAGNTGALLESKTQGRASESLAGEENPLYMPSSNTAAFEQVMEIKVAGDIELKLNIDGKKQERTKYGADSYRFSFHERAELFVNDASLIDVIYNGKSLGVLGSKGRKRRIILQAKAAASDFPN